MIDLKSIEIDDKNLFDEKINFSYLNSEASFANLYMWRKSSNTKYALINDSLVVFYTKSNGKMACCFPFSSTNLKNDVNIIKQYFDSLDRKFIMESVTEDNANTLKEIYKDDLIITECPNLNDYVYFSEKLINLSGKKLHAKRNHINKFKSMYEYKYQRITSDICNKCIEKANEWLLEKYSNADEDYIAEITALKEVFNNYDKLNLVGSMLTVNDEIIAFSVGEKLNNDTFVTHIEKADTNFHGSYTIMNNEFAKNECSAYKYINREEDMGIEGIRKAKLSYYPDKIIKKYRIEFKEK